MDKHGPMSLEICGKDYTGKPPIRISLTIHIGGEISAHEDHGYHAGHDRHGD